LSDLVETYSGHRLHERPVRFQREGSWYTVVQVLDRWQEPGALCFRVLAGDGQKYLLEYNREDDFWKVGICPSTTGQAPQI
jgi:hypothetical protein